MPPENKETPTGVPSGASSPQQPPQNPPNPPDLGKILLPKKDFGPSVDSAQRVNAGILLEQEQHAAAEGLTPAAPVQTPAAPAPSPKKEEPAIDPLQTYKSDIEKVVEGGVSVVSIAAAEARRQDEQGRAAPSAAASSERGVWFSLSLIIGGVLLLAIAGGIIAYILTRPATVPVVQAPTAPFISVDESAAVSVPAGASRMQLMQALQSARQQVALSLGLIEWLYVMHPAAAQGAAGEAVNTRELLSTLAPAIPDNLLRSVSLTYLLGVHSFDENQPFLILQVDSYETAYAGMLAWERTMQDDLAPLFTRTPSPVIQNAPAPASAATSTASTTPAATSTPPVQAFVPAGFTDQVVENHDARVILDKDGNILLLWTFLGRNTVVITTNEYTLREIISRLQNAPIVPAVPGQ